jgi:hypothetical protein
MGRRQVSWKGWMSAGLLLGAAGCAGVEPSESSGPSAKPAGEKPRSIADLSSSKTALQRAADCPDLLTKIQEDAIAKLDLVVAQQKENIDAYLDNPGGSPGGVAAGTGGFAGGVTGGAAIPPQTGVPRPSPGPVAGVGGTVSGLLGGGVAVGGSAGGGGVPTGGVATPGGTGSGQDPVAPGGSAPPRDSNSSGGSANEGGGEPIGASETNTQVEGVDEADFVKLVESGKGMFLLHGSSLRKLTTFPAESLSLTAAELKIEGSPSEMFVTDDGTAVVFSSVWGYGHPPSGAEGSPGYCTPSWCGGGHSFTKITVADVSSATPKAQREIYYRGNYVSSRRYGDVVRVVLQSYTGYASDLYSPSVDWTDAWGRPYEREQIEEQLDQWRERTADSIRDTTLADWLPVVQEVKDGKLTDVEPACGSYFVPQPGISEYGLTHVLSVDVSDNAAAVGGVTVLGQASTVYSNLERLVLAQPDYRWLDGSRTFGFIEQQRTTLHMFALEAEQTSYLASGWVPGHLPTNNQQFGLDVAADHTLRVAASGRVRANPQAEPGAEDFWSTTQDNRVYTLKQAGEELSLVGKSENLGHYEQGETIRSSRFIGERAYVVTAVQRDPLIVLDLGQEQPRVLGQIEIPGFSMYVHPLDADHLITFGQSGSGGSQLQLFDVSDPASIPQPKLLDLGQSWSELANNHKAFTFYAEQNLIALPISGNGFVPELGYYRPSAGLKVIEVDAQRGFTLLGSIEHATLYQEQKCIVCDLAVNGACYSACSVPVEVRRGHFVESADATYVYAVSYGGVSVSDLDDMSTPIKTVVLPQPTSDGSSWYGTQGGTGGFVGGGSSIGGTFGGGLVGGGVEIATPPGTAPVPTPDAKPTMDAVASDAVPAERDAGSASN